MNMNNHKNNNKSTFNAKLWNGIALVAGIFAFIISILLITNYLQTNRIDPINTEVINQLVERLSENPEDELLREQIREMDLLVRKAYFTNRWQIRTGGLLLIFSVALVILAMQVINLTGKAKPEISEEKYITSFIVQKKARKWISIGGGIIVITALILAFLSHNELEYKFKDASKLAVNDQTSGSDNIDTEIVDEKDDAMLNSEDKQEANIVDQKTESKKTIPETEKSDVKEAKEKPGTKTSYDFPSNEQINKNYPTFRGPGGRGIAYQKNIPVNWVGTTGENILWKSDIPLAGYNSPVIWGDKLFISGAISTKREVYCFNANTGKLLWTALVDKIPGSPAKAPDVTNDTGHAAPTLATDGKQVFAIFSTGDIVALDMNGNRIWAKNLGVPNNHYGHSSSLMLYQDKVIVQYDHKGSAHIMALDVRNGNIVWKTKRQVKVSWASPIVVNTGNRTEIILIADPFVASYDAETGEELWSIKCMYGEVGPSVAYSDGIVFALNEYASLVAIKIGDKAEILWEDYEYLSDVPSPVATNDYLFVATSYGVVLCQDTKTGTKYWEHEFDNGMYSSPIIVEDKIYLIDNKGIMHIFNADKEFKLIAESPLGEGTVCTPAFADGKIYIKTNKNLYCIGNN